MHADNASTTRAAAACRRSGRHAVQSEPAAKMRLARANDRSSNAARDSWPEVRRAPGCRPGARFRRPSRKSASPRAPRAARKRSPRCSARRRRPGAQSRGNALQRAAARRAGFLPVRLQGRAWPRPGEIARRAPAKARASKLPTRGDHVARRRRFELPRNLPAGRSSRSEAAAHFARVHATYRRRWLPARPHRAAGGAGNRTVDRVAAHGRPRAAMTMPSRPVRAN